MVRCSTQVAVLKRSDKGFRYFVPFQSPGAMIDELNQEKKRGWDEILYLYGLRRYVGV